MPIQAPDTLDAYFRAMISEIVADALSRYPTENPAAVAAEVAPKARKKADKVDMIEKAAALAEPVAPAETSAGIAAVELPAPATPPAQVKASDVSEDRAKLVALTAKIEGGRAKALEMIRRDSVVAKFDDLPAERRAEILGALFALAGDVA